MIRCAVPLVAAALATSVALMPAAWVRSGWMIAAPPPSSSSRYSQRVYSRSPVAIGTGIRWARRTISFGLS